MGVMALLERLSKRLAPVMRHWPLVFLGLAGFLFLRADEKAALAKAHDGNVGALARLGIKTKDASGKTLKFDEIVKNMSKTFKGQAAAGANTLEGRMGRLRLMFDETKESIGAKLLPVVEKLTGWVLNKGIPAFKNFMDGTLKPLAQKIIPVLREYWGKLRAAFEDSRPGLERIAGVAKLLGQMFVEHVIPAMGKVAGIVVPLVIKAIGKLGEILPPIIVAMLRFAENVINTWKAIFTAVTGAVSGVLSAMGHLPGKGKYSGMMGALQIRLADGRTFRLGTGFSDAVRRNPPPVGSSVTYTYRDLTKSGLPRFASFLLVRDDP